MKTILTGEGLGQGELLLFFRHSVMSYSLQPRGLQHGRLPCPSLSPGICSNLCPLSWWWYLTVSSSAAPFSFCLQSSPASGSFPISWLFTSGGQSIGASASASVLPMNSQGWFPLGLTSLISLWSKGLSRESAICILKSLPSWASLPPQAFYLDIHFE